MKAINKLSVIAILLEVTMTTTAIGQWTQDWVPKWDVGAGQYINTVTPIYEDAVNLRIGIGQTFATCRLDVNGDINVGINPAAARIYRIGTEPVLRHNGINSNIFVGVNAGQINAAAANTLVGNNAGQFCTSSANTFLGTNAGGGVGNTGNVNTYIGFNSGFSNLGGRYNAFTGGWSGFSITSGMKNTFNGFYSGSNTTSGANNSFYGAHSGEGNVIGGNNSFFGALTGIACNDCHDNTFTGIFSGFNAAGAGTQFNSFYGTGSGQNFTVGEANTFLGYLADVPPGSGTIVNSTAIGANAIVTSDNKMILGDNWVNVGIGLSNDLTPALGPQDKLEIESAAFGVSGLQFRSLTSAYIPVPFNTKFLTVDAAGKVVLENVSAAVTAANAATVTGGNVEWGGPNPLIHETEVPMYDPITGEHNIYFSWQSNLLNRMNVGIGYPMPNILEAKLDVQNVTNTTIDGSAYTNRFAGRFWETGTYTTYPTPDELVGVAGICDVQHSDNMASNLGGDFYASNASHFNIGARGSVTSPAGLCVGLWGTVDNPGPQNRGVYGYVRPAPVTYSVGVYGHIPTNGVHPMGSRNLAVYGDLGILPPCIPYSCPTAPDYAGYFNGDVFSSTGVYGLSDANLKQNINDLSDPMSIINELKPKSYTFNQQQNQSIIMPSGIHFGLLAQDVEKILPGLVKESVHPARYDENGKETYAEINFKALNYTELIPFLIAGMQQQQSEIEDLKRMIDDCCHSNSPNNLQQGNNGLNENKTIIELSSANSIVLNQNDPNPFAEHTIISFFIPEDAGNVQIIIYDKGGIILKKVQISEKGEGQIEIYASNLSSGTYSYSLVANDKVIDTKTMICTK